MASGDRRWTNSQGDGRRRRRRRGIPASSTAGLQRQANESCRGNRPVFPHSQASQNWRHASSSFRCVTAQAPEHDPTRGRSPEIWNRAWHSDAECEFRDSQTRAARVLFRDPVEFSCSSPATEIRWHSLSWLENALPRTNVRRSPRTCIGRRSLMLIAWVKRLIAMRKSQR